MKAQEEPGSETVAEARHRATLMSIGDGVISTDERGRVALMNPVAERLTGWNEAAAWGKPLDDVFRIIDERTRAVAESPVARMLREGQAVERTNHTILISKDGTEFPIVGNGAPLCDAFGVTTGVVLVFRDQTAERRTRAAMVASETRYRRLFEAAKDGILILDADTGMIVDVNPFLMELTGYSHEDFLGKHLWEIGPFKDTLASKVSFVELQTQEYVRYEDLPLETADGRHIDVEFVSNVYRVDRQNVIQCNIRDITARKEAEHALEASETRYRRLFEAAKDGILILDADTGMIVDVNPFLMELTGYSHEDFLGKHLWEIGPFRDIAASMDSFAELQAKKYVRYEDLPLVARDGRKIAVEFVSNVYLVDGESVIQCNIRDITERKQAEDSLCKSERKYRLLHQSLMDAFARVDMTGRILEFNSVFESMLGYSAEEIYRLTYSDITPAQWHASEAQVITEQVLKRGYSDVYEKEYRRQDGGIVPVELRTYLIRDEAGAPVSLWAIVRDITERKRAERELQESKQLMEAVVENVPLMIFLKEAQDLRFAVFNRAGEDLLGYDRKDLIGKNNLDLFPPEQAAHFMAKDREVLASGAFVDIPEEPILTAKKGTRLLHTRKVCIKGADGVTKYLLGISEDITERKQAEETLAASEARYRSYIHATGQIGWVTNSDGEVVENLPSLRQFSGQTFEEMKGSGWAKALHPDDLGQTVQAWNSAVATKSAYEVEYRMRRHDGVYRHLLARGSPVFRADGTIREWVGTCIDITERKRMETEREKLEEQFRMSQKMEAIGGLAGGVAHDFNNLLSVILSYTGFAMDGLREGDPLKDDLLEVKKAADRAAALTRQLLAFSRKQVLRPVLSSLNQIAVGVEKMLRRILGEDIDYVQTLAPDLGLTLVDPGQIEQVLMNLVVNSRDAMPEGGKLTIETSNVEIDEEYATRHVAVTPGSYVQLVITDTGCGMDEQTRARIFEPFFTTKAQGRGTGLGLSTAYGIIKQSGGNIWVYSEPVHGTTFKVYLPRVLAATATATRPPPTVWQRSTGAETVLVVEDEEALRNVARRALDAAGYTVLTAADGNKALLTLAEHAGDIHLLVTDVVMPRMSGSALARELAVTRPTLKVLYMSGYTDDAIVHHGVLQAGTHFLGKPFTAVDLARKVREVLDEGITNLADGSEQAVESHAERKERPVDQDAVRALPAGVLKKLRKAVIAARYDQIVKVVESIRTTQPEVAAGLRRMVDLFDYDGMRDLLSQSKEEPRER